MSTTHAVVWMDHVEAHVIHFTVDTSEVDVVKTHSTHPHLHVKSGQVGSGRAPENAEYFETIVKALHESKEILLMGPANEKTAFMKYLAKHHRLLSEKIVATINADHPTDPQLLAYARKYFVKSDRMNVDPVETVKRDDGWH